MLRSKPLRRKTPLRPRSKTKAYARRERHFDYMAAVRSLPCLLSGADPRWPCAGPVQVDHAGDRAYGQKSDDRDTIPLCKEHHAQRTGKPGARGYFEGMSKDEKSTWRRWAIASTTLHVAHKRFKPGGAA